MFTPVPIWQNDTERLIQRVLDQQRRDREELMRSSNTAAQKKAREAQALVFSGEPPQAPERKAATTTMNERSRSQPAFCLP